ncbi:MAG: MATE family efflux transporter, partial [Lachnospiraceae bacterium]|nr:MATE family efflux transporter [Lachnospiraceae bacterium]
FTAQNLGAGRRDRIRNGFRAGLKMAVVVAAPFAAGYFFLGRIMMRLFLEDTGSGALQTGMTFLRIVAPFYFVVAVKLVADGVLRGAERMRQFMVSTFTDLILRVILAFVFSRFLHDTGIWLSWPVGWTTAAVMSWIFCRKTMEKKEEK